MGVTAFQVDIVRAIREAFDQLRFQYKAADRNENSPTYAKNGCRVWVPWRNEQDPLTGGDGWTQAINTTLCRVGQEFGFEARVRRSKYDPTGWSAPNGGELLWDITWLQCDQDEINAAPLVAESELALSTKEILKDFQKLLLARAGVRLMIHEHWTDPEETPDRPAAMANRLAQHVQAFDYTQPDDVYLLVALDATGGRAWGENQYHSIRYFKLGTDGAAVEWIKGEPSPFVANEPWVISPEDLEC